MFHNNKLKRLLSVAILGGTALTGQAQMAQNPLLSRTASVDPNIVFLFDDSASMVSTAIYQYGGGAGYQGNRGPNNDAECLAFTSGCIWTNPPTTVYGRSPDVNLIYYDPRVTYKRRVMADGTLMAAGSLPITTTWNVYFYKPATVTTYSVATLSVASGGAGYASSGVTASFAAAPAGGVSATASVATGPTNWLSTAVTITSGGAYSANPHNQPVTFGLPGPGGVQATGTAIAVSSGSGVVSITLDNAKLFAVNSPSSPVTCTVTFIGAGGSGATATAQLPAGTLARPVSSFTVLTGGTSYPVGTTANVNCGGIIRTGYVVGRNTVYRITGVNFTNRGSGYATAPSITFPASSGQGTRATGTTSLTATNQITSATLTNGGSGYSTCPTTLNLSGTGGGSGATFNVTCSSTISGGVNEKWGGNGTPTTTASYFTPDYLPDSGSPLASGADATIKYPNVVSVSTATTKFPKFEGRTDCGTLDHCTAAQELQNYANWKLYHSTRLELAKTGVGLAFQPLRDTFRLGWGTLGQISGRGSSSSQCGTTTAALNKGVRLYNAATQSEFFDWLYNINGNVLCTPSRIALDNVGKYFQRADAGGPWATSPTGNGSISAAGTDSSHATCRRSYALMMTDGYYNDPFTLTDVDSTTGPSITTPQTYQFTPTGPFSDNRNSGIKVNNTLADVVMKYWVTDLRPDLSNKVKTVTGDEAFWQHLNFYAIGLGLVGTIDANSPTVLQSLTGNSPSRTLDWPSPPAGGDDPRAIDDMWHATLNGRGKTLNAKTADELNRSVQQMMAEIGGKEGFQSGVAVSTISLSSDTRKYTPSYTPVTWTGNVKAFKLDGSNANETTVAWEVETLVSTDPISGWKNYSSRIPSASDRNIFVGNGATSGTRALPFTYADMGSTLRDQMGSSTVITQNLINYLRGDRSNEDRNQSGIATSGIYRARETRLGDIVNSTPVFVKNTVDLNYEKLPSTAAGQSTYRTFVTAKNARAEGMLFVGANDGMLHAFRDGTYDTNGNPVTPGGAEVFAYVPNALLPSLSKLSDKTYVHQYYVDGPFSETDAWRASDSSWTNIVMGSTGGGAGAPSTSGTSPKSAVFAIDVTSLNSGVTGLNAGSVLWEASSASNSSFAELGYVLTDIQGGVTVGGAWVAIFGNGYESKSCQASLFVVNIHTGELIKEIKTNAGNCSTEKNGLGGVRVVRNAFQQVVGVYAGDLLGNLWKFNMNDADSAAWGVDLGGQPLFKSGATQPITAIPAVLSLPMAGVSAPTTGYMVVYGTGKFYELSDITTTNPQALYGIWDPVAFGAATIPAGTAMTNTSLLVQQTVGSAQAGANGNNYYAISANVVEYSGASPKRGWYITLPNSGQRLVYPIELLASRFVLADTISPNNAPLADPCLAENSGNGYVYIVDAISGAGPSQAVLDTNGDGNINSSDMLVSGVGSSADGRNVSIIVSKNDLAVTYANVRGGAPGSTLIKISCELTGTCKLPGLSGVRHQWRQLFLR